MSALGGPSCRTMYAGQVRSFVALGLPLIGLLVFSSACEPRQKGAAGPVQSASIATAPTTTPPPPPTTTAPPAWTIPGLAIPGLPTSPRQGILGKWNVSAVDGKPIATAPGMATDPLDPASYAAGTQVQFTADTVTISRVGLTLMSRPYKVVSEIPPVRVTIDAGYGPSNLDFALDGTCLWSMPSTPPHVLSLSRTQ